MPLESEILKGNARLEQAFGGGPAIRPAPPRDDADAVRRIQKALRQLGYAMTRSYAAGQNGEPDGVYGQETADAVISFQRRVFPGKPYEWDGRVGKKTLEQMDPLLPRPGQPTPTPTPTPPINPVTNNDFICGPDVTTQVAATWGKVQTDFRRWTRVQKIRACNRILLPIKDPVGLVTKIVQNPTSGLEAIKAEIRAHADIDGWDTLPLFQGASEWLRRPPVFDPTLNGPCAKPSSSDFNNTDPFAAGHEDPNTCSNTVQVAGKCWLNGSVNYGLFGVMVRECSDFAANDWMPTGLPTTNPFDSPLKFNPIIRGIYSLTWATMLIKAYKKFGNNPEGAVVPVAWTEATFNGGPSATPSVAENRPRCKCSCGCKGDIVNWDYVWEPEKPRSGASGP